MDADVNPTLQELLDEELGSDPTTVRGLTNHLPMALVAKAGLGADADELVRFAAAYASRIHDLDEPTTRLTRETWRAAIGNYGAAADLRSYFAGEVAERGPDEVLRSHLPALIPGVSGAAFHGVIRLAYAIEVSSPSRIAAGLAYLAETGSPLKPLVPGRFTTLDPSKILSDLSAATLPPRPKLNNITEEMHAVAQSDLFDDAVSSLEIADDTLPRLAESALHLYASTDNFTALHGVTGVEAISRLRPWIDDHELLSRYAFQALAAAYLSIGAPSLWSRDRLDEFVGTNESDSHDVAAIAAFSNDEHVSKLVYTAQRSWELTGEPLYLAVAARKAHSGT
jgi:questin oxidase-like protein